MAGYFLSNFEYAPTCYAKVKMTGKTIQKPIANSAPIRELAHRHGPAAFEKLVSLLESKDERLVLAVAQEILNRAYGKPDSGREVQDEGNIRTVVVVRGDRGEALPDRGLAAGPPPNRSKAAPGRPRSTRSPREVTAEPAATAAN